MASIRVLSRKSSKSLPYARTAKKKGGQKKRRSVTAPKAEPIPFVPVAPEAKPEPAPYPAPSDVLPFHNGAVNEAAPLMTLVTAMFEAPDMPCEFKDPSAQFMANALLTVADEVELIDAANGELDRSQTLGRAAMRTEWRAKIAVEIARRLEKGEVL